MWSLLRSLLPVRETSPLVATLVVNPGDRVMVGLHGERLTQEQGHRIKSHLESKFPEVTFVLVAGVSCLAVQHAECDASTGRG